MCATRVCSGPHWPLTRTVDGLSAAPLSERRDVIMCIHNAPDEFSTVLRKMWGNKTAEEAHAVLEKPDVKVTNQKDKDVQLPKLQKLDTFAKSVVADVVRMSEGWACPPLGALLRHGWLGTLFLTSGAQLGRLRPRLMRSQPLRLRRAASCSSPSMTRQLCEERREMHEP